jgi:hypothetical protein
VVEIDGGYGNLTSVLALLVLFAYVYFKAIAVFGFEITERVLFRCRALGDATCCCC